MANSAISRFLAAAIGAVIPALATAQSTESVPEPVIPAQVDRRDVRVPKIKANDFEIGAYVGILSVQGFGSKPSAGLRLGYHVTEDFFLEGTYGRSKVSDESYRRLGIPLFTSGEVAPLTYYNLSVGWNLFPGEVFTGKDWAMTSAVYLVGGLGDFRFAGQSNITYDVGIGIRVLPKDWISLRFEMRDHIFSSDLLGKNELTHNFEMTFGIGAYF
ncbi:MAG TPA: outer membrane beta-barrel domain-containing protein [Burkholderiales bacterium]|nr:outer membrane beta-barrel domain-containing protein [Burkholderiales bacterium]